MAKSEAFTIDMTPTWEQAVSMFVVLIERGDAKGRNEAIKELQRMGRLADLYVAEHKPPRPVDPTENIGSIPGEN